MTTADLPDGPSYSGRGHAEDARHLGPGHGLRVTLGLCALAVVSVLVIILAAVALQDLEQPEHRAPRWNKLARAYDHDLRHSEAIGWRQAAAALRAGKTVDQAAAVHQKAAQAAREERFEKLIVPALARIAPESSDLTPDQREQLAQALEALASVYDHGKPDDPRPPPGPAPDPTPPAPTPAPSPFSIAGPMGWRDHAAAREQIIAALPTPTLTVALPGEVGGPGSDHVYLYKAWKEVLGTYPEYPAQQIGDCTSFGSGHAADLEQCIELALTGGDRSQYRETCTEAIYGMGRELANMLGGGDGCYGAAVSKALVECGAVTRELVGPYSGQRAKDWGRRGVPSEIKEAAAKHKMGGTTLITSLDEADAALRNCYPFIICSNQGFSLQRDADGVCQPSGSWAHCMFVCAMRTHNGERQYLICNSWGPRMPQGPISDDQPPFSFWAGARVVQRMLQGRDSFAFSKFGPFCPRPVPARWTYSGFALPRPGDVGPPQQARPRVPQRQISAIVRRITPDVIKALEARKLDILEDAGNWPRREAIKLAWPHLIKEVPNLLQAGVDLLRDQLQDPAPVPLPKRGEPAPKATPKATAPPAPTRPAVHKAAA